jgi:hypothetical protein
MRTKMARGWHRTKRRLDKEDYFRGTKYEAPRKAPPEPVLTCGKKYFAMSDDEPMIRWAQIGTYFGVAGPTVSTYGHYLEKREAIRLLTLAFTRLGGDVVVDCQTRDTVFIDDDIPLERLDEAVDLFVGHDVKEVAYAQDLQKTGFVRLTA